ncbi:MAG TPA: 8-oxo-dGTP diphosphatase MutT [Elusimicrobiales bacterium]|nr:8-oxo-dGTP diphosphatase MutT [Elusimicrobiales bacterium]
MKQVTAAVIEKEGKILLARRKQGGALAGKWEFPGGKVEPGETPEQCLRRELREELGVDTKIGGFICSSKFEYKHLRIELLVYRASPIAGEFTAIAHERLEWAAVGELANYDLSSADIPVAALLQQQDKAAGK